jgi:hypothetical protein
MQCFAAGPRECAILKINMGECQGKHCSYYKTQAQLEAERVKAMQRIRRLDKPYQAVIRDKYGVR